MQKMRANTGTAEAINIQNPMNSPYPFFNGHGIHERTRKNKFLKRHFSVFFRGFRGNNIYLY